MILTFFFLWPVPGNQLSSHTRGGAPLTFCMLYQPNPYPCLRLCPRVLVPRLFAAPLCGCVWLSAGCRKVPAGVRGHVRRPRSETTTTIRATSRAGLAPPAAAAAAPGGYVVACRPSRCRRYGLAFLSVKGIGRRREECHHGAQSQTAGHVDSVDILWRREPAEKTGQKTG